MWRRNGGFPGQKAQFALTCPGKLAYSRMIMGNSVMLPARVQPTSYHRIVVNMIAADGKVIYKPFLHEKGSFGGEVVGKMGLVHENRGSDGETTSGEALLHPKAGSDGETTSRKKQAFEADPDFSEVMPR